MAEERAVAALRRSTREPDAFVRFYDEHAEAVLAFLARRVYEPEVALDLTAETFAQAYISRDRFRGDSDAAAAAWLFRIARRQLARYFRRGQAENRALRRLGIMLSPLAEEEVSRIEELADLVALRAAVRTELERLSDSQREALRLRVIEELPYSEVAGRLGVTEQAARTRVSRGLRALAAALDRSPTIEEAR